MEEEKSSTVAINTKGPNNIKESTLKRIIYLENSIKINISTNNTKNESNTNNEGEESSVIVIYDGVLYPANVVLAEAAAGNIIVLL